jgi:oligopeptide transport system permease protein
VDRALIRFAARRALSLAPTLLAIVVLAFLVIRLAPGSPFLAERALAPDLRAALEARYGLDRPLPEQLLGYLGNLLRGDLGLSTRYPQRTVNEILADGLPATLLLGAAALAWALLLGVGAGLLGALRRNSRWDHGSMVVALIGISVPTFVLGPLLVLFFSLRLYWLPPAGWGEARHLVLPALTLGTAYAAAIARLTRAGVLEVLESDFVRAARAKGLPEARVIAGHVLRGGLMPLLSWLGPAVAHLMVGSVVVERIFNTPGIGPYLVDAALNRDYFLVMGIVLLYSTLVLCLNWAVDVTHAVLDPRVRGR